MTSSLSPHVNQSIFSKSLTSIEYYFLFLIQEKNKATYQEVYNETIKILQKYLSNWSREKPEEYQGWTRWYNNDIVIDGQTYICEVSYYKKRIIIKFVGVNDSQQFNELFKERIPPVYSEQSER